jgi:hypothetical protein
MQLQAAAIRTDEIYLKAKNYEAEYEAVRFRPNIITA